MYVADRTIHKMAAGRNVDVHRFEQSAASRPGEESGRDLPALPGSRAHHSERGAALRGSAALPAETGGTRVPVRCLPYADLSALHGAPLQWDAHRAVAAVHRGGTGAREIQFRLRP